MTALKPLTTLLECAERERDDARTRFERARAAHLAATEQADSLRAWRSEYAQRWQTQFQTGGSVEIVRCYQDFMSRLGQAIAEQDIAVERGRNSLEAARSILQVREQRVGAVEQLIDRRRRENAQAENRREQKATDEQAARLLAAAGGHAGGMPRFGLMGGDDEHQHGDFASTTT